MLKLKRCNLSTFSCCYYKFKKWCNYLYKSNYKLNMMKLYNDLIKKTGIESNILTDNSNISRYL